MGSNFSREGSKDNRSSRGGGGGGRGRGGGGGGGEKKRDFWFAVYDEPGRRLSYGTKEDDKHGNRLRIRSSVEVKEEKEKRGGIIIFISAITFILLREFTTKVIQWKKEEKEKGKDTTCSSSSIATSSFSSLSDELQLLIMSKVPFHSLVKFRRVSKTWCSWIYKEHLFLGKCPQHTVGFFFYGLNGFTYIPLTTNGNYNYSEEDSGTIFYPPSTSLLPFPTINEDDDDDGDILTFKFCYHASNGLLLLSTFQLQTLLVLVHNPLTRHSVLLPAASHDFSGNPLWIGYEPGRSPYFYVVHAVVSMPDSDSPVLQIFSSRSWTWRDLVTTDLRPTYSPRYDIGRAVTNDGRMFIDLTFLYAVILIVDLCTGKEEDYVIVPLPPGLPPLLKYACSALGMSAGNIMYAYTHGGVLLVYKLLCLGQGDYRWTLLIEDKSLPDRIASKTDMAPTCRVHARDFLSHVPVLLISADCSKTRRRKIFSYNFNNGSILELFETEEMYNIIPLSLCPLEI